MYEDPDRLWPAIECFNDAIEVDGGFALAHAGFSWGEINRHFWGYGGRANLDEANDLAHQAAYKAMALDSSPAESRNALAAVLMFAEMDWAGAQRELLHALELNPALGDAHSRYALFLRLRGRYDEAVHAISRTRELRFLDDSYGATYASSLWGAGRYTAAAEVFGTVTAVGPTWDLVTCEFRLAQQPWVEVPPTRFNEFHVYWDIGRSCDEAFASLLDNLRQAGPDSNEVREYERRWAGVGWNAVWEAEWHLEPPAEQLYFKAAAYARLGRSADAINTLRTAHETGAPGLFWYHSNPFFRTLKDDPAYLKLMHEIGLRP